MARLTSAAIIGGLLLGLQEAPIQAAPSPALGKVTADQNERVCENVTMVGSRLAKRRVCATRAEWAEKRKLDREALDDIQRRPADPCNAILTHTGAATC